MIKLLKGLSLYEYFIISLISLITLLVSCVISVQLTAIACTDKGGVYVANRCFSKEMLLDVELLREVQESLRAM